MSQFFLCRKLDLRGYCSQTGEVVVLEINEGVGSSRHERCGRVLVERQKVGEKVGKI